LSAAVVKGKDIVQLFIHCYADNIMENFWSSAFWSSLYSICLCSEQGAVYDLLWWFVIWHCWSTAMLDGHAWEEHCSIGDGLSHCRFPHPVWNAIS